MTTKSPHCFYRHHKGGLYRLKNDNVTRESDGERMVHYAKEKDEVHHRTFVRPYEEFFGDVEPGKRRFEPIMSMADLKPKEPAAPAPTFHHVLQKGGEYYQCAQHMNLRGRNDVMRETETLVRALRDQGKTFDELLAFMEQEAKGQKPNLEHDLFLQHVQKLWGASGTTVGVAAETNQLHVVPPEKSPNGSGQA